MWLKRPEDIDRVIKTISELEGVEEVLSREEAAARFGLMPERIVDLVVLGDKGTVFGEMETETENLKPSYRSHGSTYELEVPLIVYNYDGNMPPAEKFRNNLDLTSILFQ